MYELHLKLVIVAKLHTYTSILFSIFILFWLNTLDHFATPGIGFIFPYACLNLSKRSRISIQCYVNLYHTILRSYKGILFRVD